MPMGNIRWPCLIKREWMFYRTNLFGIARYKRMAILPLNAEIERMQVPHEQTTIQPAGVYSNRDVGGDRLHRFIGRFAFAGADHGPSALSEHGMHF